MRDNIAEGVKPVIEEIRIEAKYREAGDNDIKAKYLETQRYERESAVAEAGRKELSSKVDLLGQKFDVRNDQILQLLREQDRKFTEYLLQKSK